MFNERSMSMLCLLTHAEIEDKDSHNSRGNERFIRKFEFPPDKFRGHDVADTTNEAHANNLKFANTGIITESTQTRRRRRPIDTDGLISITEFKICLQLWNRILNPS